MEHPHQGCADRWVVGDTLHSWQTPWHLWLASTPTFVMVPLAVVSARSYSCTTLAGALSEASTASNTVALSGSEGSCGQAGNGTDSVCSWVPTALAQSTSLYSLCSSKLWASRQTNCTGGEHLCAGNHAPFSK